MTQQRFFRDTEVEDFLATVMATSRNRVDIVPSGAIVYRAQLGHDWRIITDGDEEFEDICGLDPLRMTPLRCQASEGRANPKGLPVLYVGTEEKTAMAEVRPWIGAHVSCAQFKIKRDLSVIRCSPPEGYKRDTRIFLHPHEYKPEERENKVWDDIDEAFSTPVTPNDMVADYVPTQILAELFKTNGYDGVAYQSSLGDGHNLALFDLDCAEICNCSVYRLEKIDFSFNESANRYFVTKK